MADNVTLPGTGTSVAADDIGGALYQRVKVAVGADGAAADLAFGEAAMAASLPVVIASDQTAVPVSDGSGSLTVDGTVTVAGAAADDAAASGNPVPIGGVYQATVDAVDDGDVGRLRMTARRALVTGADAANQVTEYDALPASGDPLIVPLSLVAQYSNAQISVVNNLDVTVTVSIYKSGAGGSIVASFELAPIQDVFFGIGAKQSGLSNNYIQVDALQFTTAGTMARMTFSGAPSSGKLLIIAYYL